MGAAIERLVFVLTALVFLGGMVGCNTPQPTKFGIEDASVSTAIVRANELTSLRNRLDFSAVEKRLNADLLRFQNDPYALLRLRHELAELYSYHLMDLERANELDEAILASQDSDVRSSYALDHSVANNTILADKDYRDKYLNALSVDIKAIARLRLSNNRRLIAGDDLSGGSNYTKTFLVDHLSSVSSDVLKTYPKTDERAQMVSRLIRAEYELFRLTGEQKFIKDGFRYLLEGDVLRVDYAEIGFLGLADYLSQAFRATGDVRLAQYALDAVYLPYINLRDHALRWRYNKRINDYISTLIEANHRRGRYDEMLYYISLNKSRMLLEERLAFAAGRNAQLKIGDLSVDDGIVRNSVGLPDKQWFKARLENSPPYLDFYVGGKYVTQGGGHVAAKKDRSSMPLTLRDFGIEDASARFDSFADDALYISQVANGRVVAVRKLTGSSLKDLKQRLEAAYLELSDIRRGGKSQPVAFLQKLRQDAGLPANLVVSPDKWLARHPVEMHLGVKATLPRIRRRNQRNESSFKKSPLRPRGSPRPQ